ncbi:hypothetical protein PLESTB_001009100 [Pleodorina starrii]|uniref:CHCH domain-containing protein n=1 Tax=Pleodorina starrii TaxID=330485 RepID=A0A9W6F3Y9_9CHLO|nr:hypothetical protein PLESTM_001198400 [Pleodorina starrii]GLC55633.1 hypothetical protein PLESTB_001009100 [Pleodorina starrii]GLC65381.1 hypothetical protein PLESTF_000287400 [Pleodorina starrii]
MPRQRSAPAPARSAASAASRPKPAASSPPPPAPSAASAAAAPAAAAPAPQSSGGWFSRPAPQPAAPQATAPPSLMAAPAAAAPPAVSSGGGGIMSGLIGTVVQGAALGTGTAIAHRAVDAVMGPRTVVHEHQGAPAPTPAAPASVAMPPAEGPCGGQVKAFAECMSKNSGDMGACQWYFDAMQQCKLSSA